MADKPIFDPGQVAETIAGTLIWAANQASCPAFIDFVGLDIGEITFKVNLPGGESYRMIVERIEED